MGVVIEFYTVLFAVGAVLAAIGLLSIVPVRGELAASVLLEWVRRQRKILRAKRLRLAQRNSRVR